MSDMQLRSLEADTGMKRCRFCAESIRAEAVKCRYCGSIVESRALGALTRAWVRPRDGRKIAGVCMGLADEFGISVTLIRLAFLLGFLFSVGIPFLLLYAVLWIVMPDEERDAARRDRGNPTDAA